MRWPPRRRRRSRRQAPCGPGRAQSRGVCRLVGVLLADPGHREARVVEGGTNLRIGVEVLPVLLAERVTVTGPGELDPGVAGSGAGMGDAAEHELVPGRCTAARGVSGC